MITPERIDELFQCTKMHLTSDKYDFFKYGGKKRKAANQVSTNPFIFLLAKKFKKEEDFLKFLIANNIHYVKNNSKVCSFIGEFSMPENMLIYQKFDQFLERKNDVIEDDLRRLFDEKENVKNFDFIFSKVLNNEISLYTVIYLNSFTNVKNSWKASILYEEYELFLRKICPFLKMNRESFLKSIAKVTRNRV